MDFETIVKLKNKNPIQILKKIVKFNRKNWQSICASRWRFLQPKAFQRKIHGALETNHHYIFLSKDREQSFWLPNSQKI
jgi:hypothetical protein